MLKPLFCLFIFGALLQGAVSDIKCYLEGLLPLAVQLSLVQIDSLDCSAVKVNIATLTELAKTCSSKVDISKVDTLINDFCNKDSEIYKKYVENKECFDSKSVNASLFECKMAVVDTKGSTDIVENMKKVCPLFEPYFKCWNKNVGDPCEKDGSQVIKTITDAMSSFTKSVCDEVNGVSATGAVSWVVLLGILLVMTLQKY